MEEGFLTHRFLVGEQRKLWGPTAQAMGDFSFWGRLTVRHSQFYHKSGDPYHTWSQKFRILRAVAVYGSRIEGSWLYDSGDSREMRRRLLPPACHARPFKIFCLLYTHEDPWICSTTDERHRLPLGGKTLRVEFRRT